VKEKKSKESQKQINGNVLIRLARTAITQRLLPAGKKSAPDLSDMSFSWLKEKRGVFVTLQKNGALRGCIGTLEPEKTILESVQENACHAAFDDTRFSPVTLEELEDIQIEVSLLSVPEKLHYSDAQDLLTRLVPFQDGVIVQKGYHRSTFLPQVWEQLPDPESFLTQLCQKARLDAHAWQAGDLTVFTYQVQSFTENR
jgi:uncharacterized protein